MINVTGSNGSVDWTFNPTGADIDFLRAGQIATLTFNVVVNDGSGTDTATVTRPVTITVTGTNDLVTDGATVEAQAGTIGDPLLLGVTEVNGPGTAPVTAGGIFDFVDGDLTGNIVQVIGNGGTLATLGSMTAVAGTPTASGHRDVTYTYNNTHGALDYLAQGETATAKFIVRVLDQDSGGFLDKYITVTATGTNDAPVITTAAVTANLSEAGGVTGGGGTLDVMGSLAFTDVDAIRTGEVASFSVVASGTTAGLSLNTGDLEALLALTTTASGTGTTGSVGYTWSAADSDFDYLGAGDTLTLTYTVTVTDTDGGTGTKTITINIAGSNDAPVVTVGGGDSAALPLIETNAGLTGLGTLSVNDVDLTDVVTASVNSVAVNASSSGGADGGLSNAALKAFLSIALHTDLTAALTGDGSLTWNFNSGPQAFNHLGAGQTLVLDYVIRVADDAGGFDDQTVTVTITGTNDVPVITAQTGTPTLVDTGVNNTFANVIGTLVAADADSGASLSFAFAVGETGIGTYGTLTVNANGAYTFVPNSVVINALQSGSFTEVFDVKVDDGQGGIATTTLTFNITAGNDTPEISAVIGTPTLADSAANNSFTDITGTLTSTDRDTGATATYGLASGEDGIGAYGTLTVGSNGAYTFVANALAINGLQSGSASDVFNVQVNDGQGGITATTITINVTGSNDTPEITAEVGLPTLIDTSATNTFANVTGQLDATDRDNSPALTYSLVSGAVGEYGTLTVNANGSYTYVPNATAINSLGGSVDTDVFNVQVSDGNGGTASTTVTFNITGGNDTPVAVADTVAALAENTGVNVSVLTNDTDADAVDGKSLVSIDTLTASNFTGLGMLNSAELATLNSYFTANTGTGQVQFNPGAGLPGATESIFDRLDAGETATITLTYTMQDTAGAPSSSTVTFTINGAREIVTGSGGSDLALDGTDYADIVNGLVGDDRIDGLGGNDIITGGQGVDTIAGGTGTDTAVYSGAWKDYAISQAVGGTITLIDQRTGTPDGTDHVNTVELFEFSNGTYTAAQILNDAPVVANAITTQAATEDSAFSFVVPPTTFSDADAPLGDTLTYSATLGNGSPLPAWLSFDAGSRTFSGTPINGDVGALSLKVTATDLAGATVASTFTLNVANTNDAPTVERSQSQAATEDRRSASPFRQQPSMTDVGDTVTYSARWLTAVRFPAVELRRSNGNVQRHPPTAKIGRSPLSHANRCGWALARQHSPWNRNSSDRGVQTNGTYQHGGCRFSFLVPVNAYTDFDAGETLTYGATQPTAILRRPGSRSTPRCGRFRHSAQRRCGDDSVKVTATDGASASITDTFDITVTNTNDAPTAVALSARSYSRREH